MLALQMNASAFKFVLAKVCAAILGKKAYYIGPGKTVRLVDIPEPSLPGREWVKLRTIYCGFCGSDLNLIMLHDSPSAQPFTSFPCVMGHEFIGEIVEIGDRVRHFTKGDRVAVNPALGCLIRQVAVPCDSCRSGRMGNCENAAEGIFSPGMFLGITRDLNGGFAETVVAHESQLFPIPPGLSMTAAVMTEPLSVALQTVYDSRPSAGETLLIIGGGVIGNLIVRVLRALVGTCTIAVIEPSAFAAEMILQAGADLVIPPDNAYQETARLTGARVYQPIFGSPMPMGGFHRVYDTVGNTATLHLAMRLMRTQGVLSVVGIGNTVKLDPTPLWLKLQTLKGVYGSGVVDDHGRPRHLFAIALEMMKDKCIQADLLVTHKFRIEEYRQMLAVNILKERYRAMKTVVAFQN